MGIFKIIIKEIISYFKEKHDMGEILPENELNKSKIKYNPLELSTSQKGLDLIKEFEGFVPTTYLCPAKIPTIGYGHTGKVDGKTLDMNNKITISRQKAEELLREDVKSFELLVKKYITVPLTQNQFDALVSFTYNLGGESLRNSTLRKVLNQGKYNEVSTQLMRWVFANGKRLEGLIRRRAAEADLFKL